MEKKFLGVCLWLSKKLDIDVSWIRIAFVLATIIGVGTPILVYFVLYVLLHLKLIE